MRRDQNRRRDVIVMLLFLLTVLAMAMISYGRMRVHQDVRTIQTSPVHR
jgi:hypothetical protein